jgi:hypothetical protein
VVGILSCAGGTDPSLTTSFFPNATPQVGDIVSDIATLDGFNNPTGTLTFEFFTTINGTGPHTDQIVSVNGNGNYTLAVTAPFRSATTRT